MVKLLAKFGVKRIVNLPLKDGRLTPREQAVAEHMAQSGNRGFVQYATGMSQSGVSAALRRPAVQAEIVKREQDILFNELLPLAVQKHREILESPTTPPGARIQAVKLVYDRTLGVEGASAVKEPHEMTSEEIGKAIADLTRVAASRAKDITPDMGILG